MKIHYQQFLDLLIVFFISLTGLGIAKLFGFGFALDLLLLWKIFLLPLVFFLSLEGVKNRVFIMDYCRKKLKEQKESFNEETKIVQGKVTATSPFFKSELGQLIAYLFAYFFISCKEIFNLLKKTVFSKYLIFAICFFGVIFEIFVITSTAEWLVYFFTIIWILDIYLFKFSYKISAIAALIFLGLTPILLTNQKDFLAEKAANWGYMFLLVGVIQLAIENRKEILDIRN